MGNYEMFYSLLVLIVFYIAGGVSTGMIALMLWPQYSPWVGLLTAVIYIICLTLIMGIASNYMKSPNKDLEIPEK